MKNQGSVCYGTNIMSKTERDVGAFFNPSPVERHELY